MCECVFSDQSKNNKSEGTTADGGDDVQPMTLEDGGGDDVQPTATKSKGDLTYKNILFILRFCTTIVNAQLQCVKTGCANRD